MYGVNGGGKSLSNREATRQECPDPLLFTSTCLYVKHLAFFKSIRSYISGPEGRIHISSLVVRQQNWTVSDPRERRPRPSSEHRRQDSNWTAVSTASLWQGLHSGTGGGGGDGGGDGGGGDGGGGIGGVWIRGAGGRIGGLGGVVEVDVRGTGLVEVVEVVEAVTKAVVMEVMEVEVLVVQVENWWWWRCCKWRTSYRAPAGEREWHPQNRQSSRVLKITQTDKQV